MIAPRVSPLVALPIVAALLVICYAVFWFFAATSGKSAMETWVAERQAEGYKIEKGEAKTRGFPGSVEISMNKIRIQAPPEEGGWLWQGEGFNINIIPWSPRDLEITFLGTQHFRWREKSGASKDVRVSGDTLQATIHLKNNGFDALSLGLRGVQADGSLPYMAANGRYHLNTLDAALVAPEREGQPTAKTTTWRLTVDANGLKLPASANLPFSSEFSNLQLVARVLGYLPKGGKIGERVNQWREEGGTVEVDRLNMDWDPLSMKARGTLALDDAMQPTGSFAARLQGFFPAVDHLAKKGVVRSRDASMARVVLGLLAKKPADGGPPELNVPINIQNRMLSVGPLQLMALPRVDWGYHLQRDPGEIRPGFEIGPEGEVIR